MNHKKKQFCPKGHDTFVTGRINRRCIICRYSDTKKWIEDNKERRKQYRQIYVVEYYEKNKDKIMQYKKEHPEVIILSDLRKNKKRKLRIVKWGQDGMQEFYLNKPENMTVDHVIPLCGRKVSGLHVIWNLQYLTKRENSKKHNKANLTEISKWYGKLLEKSGLK